MLTKLADLFDEYSDTLAAIESLDNGKALSMANRGQPFDHLLSDLIGREPLLPEHLRSAVKARP